MNQRDRLVERIARSLSWEQEPVKDLYRRKARAVVADLYDASAEGKAIERALKVVEKNVA